jgi:Domain of unknown function (DUF4303)
LTFFRERCDAFLVL